MTSKTGQQIQVTYLVEEFVEGSDLFAYVSNTGPFSESICRYFFKQMLSGINHIHQKGHSHRDLRMENMLIDLANARLKIADFGFSAPVEGRDGSGMLETVLGQPNYMAPEIVAQIPYQGQVIDLFALAVTLFTLLSGHPPFNLAHQSDCVYVNLIKHNCERFWMIHSQGKPPGFYSSDFK